MGVIKDNDVVSDWLKLNYGKANINVQEFRGAVWKTELTTKGSVKDIIGKKLFIILLINHIRKVFSSVSSKFALCLMP